MEWIRSYYHTPAPEEMKSSVYVTWAGHRVCNPDHSVGPRVLDNYKLVLVIRGKGRFHQNQREYGISPGDLFALYPGVKHFYCADPEDPWEILWVSFNGRICGGIMDTAGLSPDQAVISGRAGSDIRDALERIVDSLESNAGEYALKATGYLYVLFSCLAVNQSRLSGNWPEERQKKGLRIHTGKEAVRKAIAFIELNYYNDIDVDTLSRHVHFSRSHFSRLFGRETGLSVPEYLNRVRVERAMELMTDSSLSVLEVAKSVGFEDQFYFSRVFKVLTGRSPLEFRKQIAHKNP